MNDDSVIKIRVSGKRSQKEQKDTIFKKLVKKEWKIRKKFIESKEVEYQKPNIDTKYIKERVGQYDKKVKQCVDKIKHQTKTYAATQSHEKLMQICNAMRADTLKNIDRLISFATSSLGQFTRNTQTIQHLMQEGATEARLTAIEKLVDTELKVLSRMEMEFLKQRNIYSTEVKNKNQIIDSILGQLSQTDSMYVNYVHALWGLELRRARWTLSLAWPE